MEKKIAGLLGAAATLGTLNAAQASPAQDDILRANSFAELLEPISNAASLLQAIDESTPPPSANVQLAQFISTIITITITMATAAMDPASLSCRRDTAAITIIITTTIITTASTAAIIEIARH